MIHLSAVGYLVCFYFLAIINMAEMNMEVKEHLGIFPEVEYLSHIWAQNYLVYDNRIDIWSNIC